MLTDDDLKPGAVRIVSNGTVRGSKVEVLGADGQWVMMRNAMSAEINISGPDVPTAVIRLFGPGIDVVVPEPVLKRD